MLYQGISSVCVCLSLDLTQGVPPLSFHPSNSLGKSKMSSGVGEGGAGRRGGEGRYIWKAHLELVVEGEPAGGEGVPGPFAPVSPSLKVRAAGAREGGSQSGRKCRGWGGAPVTHAGAGMLRSELDRAPDPPPAPGLQRRRAARAPAR